MNPYQRDFEPPANAEYEAKIDSPREVQRFSASARQRFVTFLVDYIAINFVMFIVMVGFGVLQTMGVIAYLNILENDLLLYGLNFAVMMSYYIILESTTGRTLGKLIAGTRVIGAQGQRPTIAQTTLRTLSRFVPFEAFSALSGGDMWHDTWSKTQTITLREPKWANPSD